MRNPQSTPYSTHAAEKADRLDRSICSLFDTARVEAGMRRDALEPNDVEDLIGCAPEHIRPVLKGDTLMIGTGFLFVAAVEAGRRTATGRIR